MKDEFYTKNNCERCSGGLGIRTLSWFNTQVICIGCSTEEDKLKAKLRVKYNGVSFEGANMSIEQIRIMVK